MSSDIDPVQPRPKRPRTPPKQVTLLVSADGYFAWAWEGERYLVMVQHDIDRPLHVLTADSEAQARAMVDRAAELHAADNNVCLVHFWQEGKVIGHVNQPRDYGGNGRMGRARSAISERRFRRERVALEQSAGIDPAAGEATRPHPRRRPPATPRLTTISPIQDDSLLTARLNGHYSPTPNALGRAPGATDPTQ